MSSVPSSLFRQESNSLVGGGGGGGFGSAVLEKLNSLGINYQLKIVASKQNNLSEIGSQAYLQKANGLDSKSIKEAFLSLRASQKK